MLPTHRKPSDDPQFHASAVHSTNLQTRLHATLDALSEVQHSHQSELDDFKAQADKLRAKSHLFKQRAKAAETERDKLKEDVNKLVEKVEIANDCRVLTPGRMRLSYPLDPMPVSVPSTSHTDPLSQKDPYYSSVVNYLATALTAERQEFSNVKLTLEERIATLEYQVARRETELQKYALYPCACRLQASRRVSPHLHTPTTAPSQEHMRDALGQAAVENRALEVEVRDLVSTVEKERIASSERRQAARSAPQIEHSGPRPSSSLYRPTHPSLNDEAHLRQQLPSHKVLLDINQQIKGLGQEIDELQVEGRNLAAMLDADRIQATEPKSSGEDFQSVLLVEEECIQLRRSQRALRQELLLSKATSTAIEQELKALVQQLQRQLEDVRNPEAENNLLLGEQDMEVEPDASATEILTTADQSARPSTPPLVSLMSSRQLSPSRHPPRFLPTTPPFSAHQDRLARIKFELNRAREDVEQKDRSIEALRAQLEKLGVAVQRRGDEDG